MGTIVHGSRVLGLVLAGLLTMSACGGTEEHSGTAELPEAAGSFNSDLTEPDPDDAIQEVTTSTVPPETTQPAPPAPSISWTYTSTQDQKPGQMHIQLVFDGCTADQTGVSQYEVWIGTCATWTARVANAPYGLVLSIAGQTMTGPSVAYLIPCQDGEICVSTEPGHALTALTYLEGNLSVLDNGWSRTISADSPEDGVTVEGMPALWAVVYEETYDYDKGKTFRFIEGVEVWSATGTQPPTIQDAFKSAFCSDSKSTCET